MVEPITVGTTGTDVPARQHVERLAAQAQAILPTLTESQARIAIGLFRMLAEGRPVSLERLAERLTLPVDEVSATLAALPAVFHDKQGRIVAFWGLGLGKTRHRVEVDGRTVYAWCLPDTLYFPRVLGKSVHVRSTSPTGAEFSLLVRSDGVESVSPEGAVVSFVQLEGKRFDDDVISNFCHYQYLFTSKEEGNRWAEEQPTELLILTIEEGFELMARISDALFGVALEPSSGPGLQPDRESGWRQASRHIRGAGRSEAR
jgi:alkylmercury lyase